MKTIFKIATGIIVAAVVLIGGCAALLGAGVHQAQKDSDKTAITLQQYRSVGAGDTLRGVEQRFGRPQSADQVDQNLSSEERKYITNGSQDLRCIYYNRKGHLAAIFQFCFDGNGRYESKSSV